MPELIRQYLERDHSFTPVCSCLAFFKFFFCIVVSQSSPPLFG